MTKHPLGKLYLVSTPIGHPDDITLRAIHVLQQVDLILCEEYKNGSRLLKQLEIAKPLLALNEHNESQQIPEILQQLSQGKTMALISDAGTPVFADPGSLLVQAAAAVHIKLIPIPGASSLMAALVCSAFELKEFHYVGFLPRQADDRRSKLEGLKRIRTLLVIYDAPYRLLPVLKDLEHVMGGTLPVAICSKLTMADEKIYRGTLKQLLQLFEKNPIKCEFVILIDNADHSSSATRHFSKNSQKTFHR